MSKSGKRLTLQLFCINLNDIITAMHPVVENGIETISENYLNILNEKNRVELYK